MKLTAHDLLTTALFVACLVAVYLELGAAATLVGGIH